MQSDSIYNNTNSTSGELKGFVVQACTIIFQLNPSPVQLYKCLTLHGRMCVKFSLEDNIEHSPNYICPQPIIFIPATCRKDSSN